MALVNKAIISNPLNWFIILSMVLLAGYTLHLVLSHYHSETP